MQYYNIPLGTVLTNAEGCEYKVVGRIDDTYILESMVLNYTFPSKAKTTHEKYTHKKQHNSIKFIEELGEYNA